MTPDEHEEHIGYARFVEEVEQAESFLRDAEQNLAEGHYPAAANWANAALQAVERAERLAWEKQGPRSRGACLADDYRCAHRLSSAGDLRERANAFIYGAAEASAITGGLVEETEA